MGLYTFVVTDRNGTALGELERATERQIKWYLNLPGAASFKLDLRDMKYALISPGETNLLIYRAGSLVWGGEIATAQDEIDGDSWTSSIGAVGWLGSLEGRATDLGLSYSGWDTGQIAWDLIARTQAKSGGNIGITAGAVTSGVTANANFDAKGILQAIQDLSGISPGFDFEITPGKVFNVYPGGKGVRVDATLEHGKNIRRFQRQRDATKMMNSVYALGSGEGTNMVVGQAFDAGSIGRYGVRELYLSQKDSSDVNALNGMAKGALVPNPPEIIGLEIDPQDPPFGAYSVGDYVRVIVNAGGVQYDSWQRVYGIEIEISDNDYEKVTIITNPSSSG